MMDKEALEYFRRKIRIELLGEPSFMPQNQVMMLCEKFFKYGLEYKEKNNYK